MLTIFNWFRNHKTIAAWCAYTWAAIIFAACLIPGRDVPSLSIFQYDKIIHFGIFGILSFLLLFRFQNPKLFKQGLYVFLFCFGYGYFVEFMQGSGITKGRSFDNLDALADSIGAALGVFIFLGLEYFRKEKYL